MHHKIRFKHRQTGRQRHCLPQAAATSEVVVWLDKTCIAPRMRGASTSCIGLLPIFVSGCQQFLILLGESYTTRQLWRVRCSASLTCLEVGCGVPRGVGGVVSRRKRRLKV